MLVGRDGEVRELLAAVSAAVVDGRGWTALLAGDAGIGKSRLAAELVTRVRADGLTTVWTECRPGSGAPAYWPWLQVLDHLGVARDAGPPVAADSATARFEFFDRAGRAIGGSAPILVVIDDLHWADDASLRLLDALATHGARGPIMVVGTYRDTDPGARRLTALRAERTLALRGLPADQLGAVLTDITGEHVSAPVLARLHRRTGGNPFFAAEIVRLLRAEGRLDGDTPEIPRSVRAVLDRRLDLVPDDAENALRAAAVLDAGSGAGVDGVLLAAVAGGASAGLAARLEPAVRAGLLIADGGRYRFPHALVAETLAARTPVPQQLELHRRAAAALDPRRSGGAGDPAGLAHHRLAAARLSGDRAEAWAAAEATAVAARSAMARTAYEDAARRLEAALAVLGPIGDEHAEPPAAGVPDRGELLCALGEAALAAGDRPRSRSAFAEAAEHARRHHRPELLATAAIGIAGGAAGFEVDLTDPNRASLLAEALDVLPSGDTTLRSAVAARLSLAIAFTGQEARRLALADEAVAMARRLGDPASLAGALACWSDVLAGPDHVRGRRAAAREIVGAARDAGDRTVELLGLRLRLVASAEAGDWTDVDATIEAYERVAERVRRPGLTWFVPLWRATRARMRDEPAVEAVHAGELTGLLGSSGSGNAEILALTQSLVRLVDEGRSAELLPDIAGFARMAPDDAGAATTCTMAMLRALNGERAIAAGLLTAFLEAGPMSPRDSEWLPAMVQSAITATLLGDRDRAGRLYETLLPYSGLFAIEGIFAGTWGCVDGHLGMLAALLDRPRAAEEHYAVALELNRAAGRGVADRTRRWSGVLGDGPSLAETAGTDGSFVRSGDVWTIEFAGRTVRLRDSKGLRDLAALLATPGRGIAVHDLMGLAVAAGGIELADRTAIDAYRRRLAVLADERVEAADDQTRLDRVEAEYAALARELSAVTGLGGRSRRAGSDVERSRKAVGNRIRQALNRISAVHPELGRHLAVSVRTGTFCSYQPERAVRWTVEPAIRM